MLSTEPKHWHFLCVGATGSQEDQRGEEKNGPSSGPDPKTPEDDGRAKVFVVHGCFAAKQDLVTQTCYIPSAVVLVCVCPSFVKNYHHHPQVRKAHGLQNWATPTFPQLNLGNDTCCH